MSGPSVIIEGNAPKVVVDGTTLLLQLNNTGLPGPAGVGVPVGGDTGQVLAKASDDDYDTEWVDAGGGGSYVPYTGATGNVDLGSNNLTAAHLVGQYQNLAGSAYINPDGSAVLAGGAVVITNTGTINGNIIGAGTTFGNNTGNITLTTTGTGNATLTGQALNIPVSGGSGDSIIKTVTQNSHGFSVKQAVYFNGTSYALGLGDSDSTSDIVGIIQSTTTNTFTMVMAGAITLSGLTPGMYFLSDVTPGLITLTPPAGNAYGHVRLPIMSAVSATDGIVDIKLGITINAVPVTAFNAITAGTNSSAAMLVGSGASLDTTGTGIINPSTINGKITLSNTVDFTLTGTGTNPAPYNIDNSAGVKGGAASLTARLYADSLLSFPASHPLPIGNYFDQGINSTARTTLAMGTNSIVLSRFIPARSVTIDQFSAYVVAASGAGQARLVIYSLTSSTGVPDILLYQSAALSTTAATTLIFDAAFTTYTFNSNTGYAVGILNSQSGASFHALNISALPSFGLTGSTTTVSYCAWARGVTFASGAPTTWNYVSTDLYSGGAPALKMRQA